MNATNEQLEVFRISERMKRDEICKISAFAGTGKTSTLIQLTKRLPHKRFLYLAFNRSIVSEAKTSFPSNVTITTTHALAYSFFGKGRQIRQDYKAIEIAKLFDLEVEIAQQSLTLLNEFLNSSNSCIEGSSQAHRVARELFKRMKENQYPLTHSGYLKLFQLSNADTMIGAYDFILLDEAQDTNPVTQEIFLSLAGAKIIVGDQHQNIYGFRGAKNMMVDLVANYHCHLTTTFRCSKEIVRRANIILSRFKGENTPLISAAKPLIKNDQYAIISRTNAKIIEVLAEDESQAYSLWRHPMDLFALPIALYHWERGELSQISTDFSYLWHIANKEAMQEYIETSHDRELATSLKMARRYKKGLYLLYKKAMKAYQATQQQNLQENKILLLTAHTSKGLEFDTVALLDDFPSLEELSVQNSEYLSDEANLYYVALTRAKQGIEDWSPNQELFGQ